MRNRNPAEFRSFSRYGVDAYRHLTMLSDSHIARSDLLRAGIYPDSDDSSTGVPPVLSDGADETYDRVEHRYNRQNQIKETKDQNGTVHTTNMTRSVAQSTTASQLSAAESMAPSAASARRTKCVA